MPEAQASPGRWREKLVEYFPQCAETACRARSKRLALPRWRGAGIYLRQKWYCSVSCLIPALERSVAEVVPAGQPTAERAHRVPIGLLLLSRGVIDSDQLRRALTMQKERGEGRLGDWLRRMGAATEADITRALAMQWGCPVFPLERDLGYRLCAGLVPLSLSEAYGMLPVFRSQDGSLLYMGFTGAVDHALLYGIERILGCRTMPCIVGESAYATALSVLESRNETQQEAVFNSVGDSFEIARTAGSFSEKLGAHEVHLAPVGRSLWVRLLCHSGARDLLFHPPGF